MNIIDVKIDQQLSLKLIVKLNQSPTNCLKMFKDAFGETILSRTRILEWNNRFSELLEYVEDEERSGRPVTIITEGKVKNSLKACGKTDI